MKTSSLMTALAGCAALAAGAGLASAATPDTDVPTTKVRYSDLDLTTDSGMHTLYQRLSAAAARVCPAPSSRDLAAFSAAQACRTQAVERAVHSISESRLVELRDNRGKAG
jgi:UrcA family protein